MAILTTAQLQAIKAEIDADPALSSQPMTSDGAAAIADALNLLAAPSFWVWRTRVTRKAVVESTSTDVDNVTTRSFNWTGTGFIGRSQGERDAWRELWNHDGAVNPSLPSVRQAFLDIFSGAVAPAPSNRTHLANMSRRVSTRAEKVLASGVGTTSAPATMGFEGRLHYSDVEAARLS